MSHLSTARSRGTVLIAAAAILALGASTGAVAGSLITSSQIKNNTIRSADVKNGAIKMRDLAPGVRSQVKVKALPGKDGVNGTNGVNGANGTNGTNGADGADGSVAGVQTTWDAKDGATIVDANTIRLSNAGTPAGASVEILDLNLPVQATKTLEFTYELSGGAVYSAGSPRIFIQIGDDFFNTFDGDPTDAGEDNGDGTFTKTVIIPRNGTVHAAGVVVDSGVGTVTVTDVVISGYAIKFAG
ncbi:MAG TPA: hypothetical protein VD764_07895 [Nocardioides sp.]|jgi:hypothetical protein|nr:hypothetical protein [Nocardioides sp.]